MADYPTGIYSPRTKANRAGVVYDAAKTTIGYAEDVTKLDDEVVAIETDLVNSPKVPYTGANNPLDLGIYGIIANSVHIAQNSVFSFDNNGATQTDVYQAGDGLIGLAGSGGIGAILDVIGLTIDRTFIFPDKSGTLALISDIPSVPVKASGAEVDTGTDDAKFATPKALKDSHNVPSVAPGTSGNVLTSDGTDWGSAAPTGAAVVHKVGLATRDYTAASETQNIAHGLGKTPLKIRLSAVVSSAANDMLSSIGAYDGTNTASFTMDYTNLEERGSTTYVLDVVYGTSVRGQKCTITVDGTNIMLAWTKVGTPPAATIKIVWEAEA